ncbi:MAG: hypothetical protein Q4A87_06000 [Streptococcus sp.]|nr:hypothetical protein [Streptococcus sp.]
MKKKSGNYRLSNAMEDYYKNSSKHRFSHYLTDLGTRKDLNTIQNAVDNVFKDLLGLADGLTYFESGSVSDFVKKECKKAFANYIYHSN